MAENQKSPTQQAAESALRRMGMTASQDSSGRPVDPGSIQQAAQNPPAAPNKAVTLPEAFRMPDGGRK
jgi:hypothetical protein